jgi:hypothetical protein
MVHSLVASFWYLVRSMPLPLVSEVTFCWRFKKIAILAHQGGIV